MFSYKKHKFQNVSILFFLLFSYGVCAQDLKSQIEDCTKFSQNNTDLKKIDCISGIGGVNLSISGFKSPLRNKHTITSATINLEDRESNDFDPDMGLYIQRWGISLINGNGFTLDYEINGIVEPLYNGSSDSTSTLLVSNPSSIVALPGKSPIVSDSNNFTYTLIENFNEVLPNMSTEASGEEEISTALTFSFYISNRMLLKNSSDMTAFLNYNGETSGADCSLSENKDLINCQYHIYKGNSVGSTIAKYFGLKNKDTNKTYFSGNCGTSTCVCSSESNSLYMCNADSKKPMITALSGRHYFRSKEKSNVLTSVFTESELNIIDASSIASEFSTRSHARNNEIINVINSTSAVDGKKSLDQSKSTSLKNLANQNIRFTFPAKNEADGTMTISKVELATESEVDALPELTDDQKDENNHIDLISKLHELIINKDKTEDALAVISKNIDSTNDGSNIKVQESNLKTGIKTKKDSVNQIISSGKTLYNFYRNIKIPSSRNDRYWRGSERTFFWTEQYNSTPTLCPPGQGVGIYGRCENCVLGATYNDKNDSSSCVALSKCPLGQGRIRTLSTSENISCGLCSSDNYSDTNSTDACISYTTTCGSPGFKTASSTHVECNCALDSYKWSASAKKCKLTKKAYLKWDLF